MFPLAEFITAISAGAFPFLNEFISCLDIGIYTFIGFSRYTHSFVSVLVCKMLVSIVDVSKYCILPTSNEKLMLWYLRVGGQSGETKVKETNIPIRTSHCTNPYIVLL